MKTIVHRVDEKKRHVEWDFELDRCMFLGQYFIEGQVLILPIKGDGDANITVSECRLRILFIIIDLNYYVRHHHTIIIIIIQTYL